MKNNLFVEQLKSLDIVNIPCKFAGLKKNVWYNSDGKQYALITFGKKRNIIIPVGDISWKKISQVVLANKQGNKEVNIDSGDLLIWLKNDFLEDLRILDYGNQNSFFYLENSKVFWEFPSIADGKNELISYTQKNQLIVPGEICYKKKQAGFYVLILGNWYFLPRGESLTYYKPGIWNSNYGNIVQQTGYYLEGASNFINSNFFYQEKFSKIMPYGQDILKILENLLNAEINYIFAKGTLKNKRTLKARNRILLAYSYFYYILLPLYTNLNKLEDLRKKAGLSQEELDIILQQGGLLEKKEKTNDINRLLIGLKTCLLGLKKSKTKKDLRFYYLYCNLLIILYKKLEENPLKIKMNRLQPVEFAISKTDTATKGKLMSVSRRVIS